MNKYISISQDTRDYLLKKYNVSKQSVWKALTFITRNKRSASIRQDALAMGGRLIEEGFIPNCKTEHRDGEMIQTFAGGVKVVTKQGDMKILVADTEVASYNDVTIESWGNVLERAQEISQKRVFNN